MYYNHLTICNCEDGHLWYSFLMKLLFVLMNLTVWLVNSLQLSDYNTSDSPVYCYMTIGRMAFWNIPIGQWVFVSMKYSRQQHLRGFCLCFMQHDFRLSGVCKHDKCKTIWLMALLTLSVQHDYRPVAFVYMIHARHQTKKKISSLLEYASRPGGTCEYDLCRTKQQQKHFLCIMKHDCRPKGYL